MSKFVVALPVTEFLPEEDAKSINIVGELLLMELDANQPRFFDTFETAESIGKEFGSYRVIPLIAESDPPAA